MIYEKYEKMGRLNIHPEIPLITNERREQGREFVSCSVKIDSEFENALYAEYSLLNNPKREIAFKIAKRWAARGEYYDIECLFAAIASLIKMDVDDCAKDVS